jgi:NAD+ diphosphatase
MSGSVLRRVAHHRTDAAWLAQAWEQAKVLVIADGRALVLDGRLVLLDSAAAPAGDRVFLGLDDEGTPYFAVLADLSSGNGGRPMTVREVGHLLDDLEGQLFITANALANWHSGHVYSPLDGRPTTISDAGWSRVGEGGYVVWPRTDPAVIALVHDGIAGGDGHCLLGHNAAWHTPGWARRYSCLAGFVEAGESAEAAVVREVAEEVGVRVTTLHYLGSQAWPYPGSLMLGFTALADASQPVRVDETEITSARWFTRTEIQATLAGERDDVALPMASSIAHFLVMEWLSERA